jgi:hypothetical protein
MITNVVAFYFLLRRDPKTGARVAARRHPAERRRSQHAETAN